MNIDEPTRQIALHLQLALTAWYELHPHDSDEEACRKSLEVVEAILQARQAALTMPPLHERLRIVMGSDECTIPDCIERLRARHESWVPESKELKAYISLTLAAHVKDHIFERVVRGVYRVKPAVPPSPLDDDFDNVLNNPFAPEPAPA